MKPSGTNANAQITKHEISQSTIFHVAFDFCKTKQNNKKNVEKTKPAENKRQTDMVACIIIARIVYTRGAPLHLSLCANA